MKVKDTPRSVLLSSGLILALVAGPLPAAADASGEVQNVWVQVVPPGKGVLRAITTARKCPVAHFDRRSRRMAVRAEPNADYDVLTCELAIPKRTGVIRVAGRRLKPVSMNPQRIAIVADTACRMKDGEAFDAGFQNCGDPDNWEFAKVAEQVAAWEPDLIIQLGDYIYREQECPTGCGNCADSPYNSPGMRMDTWNVEFFEPGVPMLEAAPLVLIRGDHEKCERAGSGFFRFLGIDEFEGCADFSDPYAIDFEELQLVVMDTAQAEDTKLSPDVVIERYAEDFQEVARLSTRDTWLMSHRPIWALRPAVTEVGNKDVCKNQDPSDTLELQKINLSVQHALRESALDGRLPSSIEAVVAGHIHVAEVLSFTGGRPPQLVAGISGTKLLPAVSGDLAGIWIDGEKVTKGMMLSEHGFFGVRPARHPGVWRADIIDVDGSSLARCRIGYKRARCRTR